MKQKRLARLTKVEDREWTCYFNDYIDDHVDKRPSRADAYAWKMLVKAFPRLAKYDGCLPNVP